MLNSVATNAQSYLPEYIRPLPLSREIFSETGTIFFFSRYYYIATANAAAAYHILIFDMIN